jgi:hypothetical protein
MRDALTTNAKNYELVFAATHPGDAEYKSAMQQEHLFVPAQLAGRGTASFISRNSGQKVGTKTLKLPATSDAHVKMVAVADLL